MSTSWAEAGASLVVEQGDRVEGLLTLHDVKKVPRSEWPTTAALRR